MAAMTDLQRLVANRLAELDRSERSAATASSGLVSHVTINNIARGLHTGQITDRVIKGLSLALDLSESKVRTAAGVTRRTPGTRFVLPNKADRLTPVQRKLILKMVEELLKADEASPEYGAGKRRASS